MLSHGRDVYYGHPEIKNCDAVHKTALLLKFCLQLGLQLIGLTDGVTNV